MKALVFDSQFSFSTMYKYVRYSNGAVVKYIEGWEAMLLRIVLQQMNMTFIHVPTPEEFEKKQNSFYHIIKFLFLREYDIIVGNVGYILLNEEMLSYTNSYDILTISWYVPCSEKFPRWSSIFRILSVELWLVLIISIVIMTILTTLVGRYSCTLERQGYKTLKSSFINIWAVILGVSVSSMPRNLSLRSLFFTWVCFSVAFSTVFQSFLTTFLTDCGYKTPIKNMDELFASGIKTAYHQSDDNFFELIVGTESLQIKRNHVNCPLKICFAWIKDHKNVSIIMLDKLAEELYATGYFIGKNSEPLLCKLEDGMFLSIGQTMQLFHGDPLTRRVNEILDRVVEAALHKIWISLLMNGYKIYSHKIAMVHPLEEYYSFNLYHMQPAFYLLFIGWCLSAICFMFELLYFRLLSKRN